MNPFDLTPEINHDERKTRIGASEVSAIMGTCDFSDIQKLWELKTGRRDPFVGNWATQRGQSLEPIVREMYEKKYSVKAPPVFIRYNEWDTLTASLDGFTGERVVEIKVPSKEKHQMAINGIVPTTYRDQLQTQMLCAGVNSAHYVSFSTDDDDIAVVEVMADSVRQSEIVNACKAFWIMVQNDTPPMGEALDQPELEMLFVNLNSIKQTIKMMEDEEKYYTEKIKSLMKSDTITCAGYKAGWSTRKGSIQYAEIPELKSVDLEKYRGKEVRIFTVKPILSK